ncbi:hypothetical protein [Paenibacillus sp. CECT 9249]|uniref:hypothetical protein n=1 Tax=Paenibacillus sp. CECT 9249 TaxID=2845385 RepID=UPI001E623362|nr:hypothetical protein [Paenibacillus sp. CECT 9249]
MKNESAAVFDATPVASASAPLMHWKMYSGKSQFRQQLDVLLETIQWNIVSNRSCNLFAAILLHHFQ